MRTLLIALALLACNAAGAGAATVTSAGGHVRVIAAAGQANDLDITTTDPLIVRDAGAPLVAGHGCTAQPDGSVSCRGGELVVRAGDRDDRVIVHGYGTIEGGPGDDVLSGDWTLRGGPGRDHLIGGIDDDVLEGGPGRDTIDGGAGVDQVSFADRRAPVMVDLADPGPDGGDTVTGVETVVGGRGDDRIAGDNGPNGLFGGAGDDVLLGRGGTDNLEGERGDDRLAGGAGDDSLQGEWLDGGGGDVRGHRALAALR